MPTAILPAALNMIKATTLYPLLVQYPVPDLDSQPCHKVWVLLKATEKSKCTEEFPYTAMTDDVEDVLNTTQTQAENKLSVPPPKYQLVSICSRESRSSLMLTPAHGKHAFALALITSVQDNTLCAETVETIQKDEKKTIY